MSEKQHALRRSRFSENVTQTRMERPSNHKNLLLASLDSSNMKSLSIPGEETLEDALIDLYLSVKIRSNDEVSFPVLLSDRRLRRQ